MSLPRIFNRRRRRLLAELISIGALQAVGVALTAWLAQQTFDALVLGAVPSSALPAAWLPLALALTYAAVAGLRYRERVAAEHLGQSYVNAARLALFDRLAALTPRAVQSRSRGGHLLRFIGDLSALRQWVSLGLARLAVASVTLGLGLGLLAFVEPRIALAVSAIIATAMALSLLAGRRLKSAAAESRRRRARLAANVNEKITAMATVQVLGQVRRERRRLGRQSRRLRRSMVERARAIARLRAVSDGAIGASTVAVLVAGGSSAGAVVAGMTVVGLLLPMVRDLGRVNEYWQGYGVARGNIDGFMNAAFPTLTRPAGTRPKRPFTGEIRLVEVSVGDTLRSISVTAPPGAKVALVGPNGAGKSTLLAVVAGLLAPDQGRILLDGVDVRKHGSSGQVSMAGPDLPLLRGSLRYNLCYRRPRVSTSLFDRVCAQCGVDEIVARLPAGLDTRISDGGLNLSAGERARVALARALMGSPRILLLDEIDAHLDATTSARIDAVVATFPGTVLMVTHEPERAARADRIWGLGDGSLIETGPGLPVAVPGDPNEAEGGATLRRARPPARLAG